MAWAITKSRLNGNTVVPSEEWDLEDLVDHVTGGNRLTVLVLGGASAEDAMAETRKSFDESHEPRTAALGVTKICPRFGLVSRVWGLEF